MTSPPEARALARVWNLPRMTAVLEAQTVKGEAAYGHTIGGWNAPRSVAIAEGAAEAVDLLAYLEYAGEVPPHVWAHLRAVCEWLEKEV